MIFFIIIIIIFLNFKKMINGNESLFVRCILTRRLNLAHIVFIPIIYIYIYIYRYIISDK